MIKAAPSALEESPLDLFVLALKTAKSGEQVPAALLEHVRMVILQTKFILEKDESRYATVDPEALLLARTLPPHFDVSNWISQMATSPIAKDVAEQILQTIEA